MPSYLEAQVTSGNYFSRKPVRANSTIRQVHAPDESSSDPSLHEPISHDVKAAPNGSHTEHVYHNARDPKLFQSNDCFSRQSSRLPHPFQLLPTTVSPPKSFAFELEPLMERTHGVLYRVGGEVAYQDVCVVYRARPHSYRELTADRLGAAYADATISAEPLTSRPVPEQITQDWRDREQYARGFSYNRQEVHDQEVEQTQAVLDVSFYLDAVEEQEVNDHTMESSEKSMHIHATGDLIMSDALPQDAGSVRQSEGHHELVQEQFDYHYHGSNQYAHTSRSR